MTLYAMLHKPIGGILAWAIPDHIAMHCPVLPRAERLAIANRLQNARFRALLETYQPSPDIELKNSPTKVGPIWE